MFWSVRRDVLAVLATGYMLRNPTGQGFDTSGNPVRQCRNQLEITNGNQKWGK